MRVFNTSSRSYEDAIVPCQQVGCHNGVLDPTAFARSMGVLPCNNKDCCAPLVGTPLETPNPLTALFDATTPSPLVTTFADNIRGIRIPKVLTDFEEVDVP